MSAAVEQQQKSNETNSTQVKKAPEQEVEALQPKTVDELIYKPGVVEWVPVELLHEDPHNAMEHPPRNLNTIKTSLVEYEQQTPIVVDDTGKILKGNGTYRTVVSLGKRYIMIRWSQLQGNKKTGYSIADNRSSELSQWNYATLGGHLKDLKGDGFDLTKIGFDELESNALIESFEEFNLQQEEGFDGLNGDDPHNGGYTEDDLIDKDKNKGFKLLITFPDAGSLEEAKAQIEQILKEYPDAYYSVSGGEL